MKISHLALWTKNLEVMRAFYEAYFGARAGAIYFNPKTRFSSYFLQFSSGARLELMQMPGVHASLHKSGEKYIGVAHFAVSVGSQEKVDELTRQLEKAGFTVLSKPRTTGDGYYESVVLDPENNQVEITV